MNQRNAPIRTLVVDDDNCMSQLICKILTNQFGEDLAITSSNDAQTAIGMAIANPFELCISDLNMPGTNGFKVLKVIKGANPLTQVILLTAYPDENAIKSAFSLGADDYLMKPIQAVQLCSCIEFMMKRIRRFRTEILSSKESDSRGVFQALSSE